MMEKVRRAGWEWMVHLKLAKIKRFYLSFKLTIDFPAPIRPQSLVSKP